MFRFVTRCVLNGECSYPELNLSCTVSLLYHLAVAVVCFDEQTQLLVDMVTVSGNLTRICPSCAFPVGFKPTIWVSGFAEVADLTPQG